MSRIHELFILYMYRTPQLASYEFDNIWHVYTVNVQDGEADLCTSRRPRLLTPKSQPMTCYISRSQTGPAKARSHYSHIFASGWHDPDESYVVHAAAPIQHHISRLI